MTDVDDEARAAAERALDLLVDRDLTLAVAESLTGGLVMAAITSLPGSGDALRGGAVTYATDTKSSQLGVDADLLATRSPVDPDVAAAMARGVRLRWGADLGLSTTGVAGPDSQDGHPVGEVYVGLSDRDGEVVEPLDLQVPLRSADSEQVRAEIRQATVRAAFALITSRLGSP